MGKAAFIGIDVSCSKTKRIPIVIATKENGRLIPLPLMRAPLQAPKGPGNAGIVVPKLAEEFAGQVRDYVNHACEYFGVTAKMIALDAPLEPRVEQITYRLAEKSLASKGISSFKTPSASEFEQICEKASQHLASGGALMNIPHSMQLWMLAGFEIAKVLKPAAPIIEVFPQAIFRRLLPNTSHKSKSGVAAEQLQALAAQTGWPVSSSDLVKFSNICSGAMHDKVDAYSAAWVSSLSANERESYGDDSDAIWVPKPEILKPVSPTLLKSHITNKINQQVGAAKAQASEEPHRKICPACKDFVFKRWPFGWDAHAAYRCAGLPKREPKVRKAIFKLEYL